jgi:nitrite reductase/ring-hydroxylating ferredoxin subunit
LESGYLKIAQKTEITVGKMKKFVPEGKEILIANINGNYYAIEARCPHKAGELLQGTLEGNIITCPNHGAKFDATTGKVISPPKMGFFHPKIKDAISYQVKIENGYILVKL